MDWNLIIKEGAPFAASVFAILGGMYGMLKIINKDTHKQVEILEKDHQEFKQEIRHVNNRLDGIYRVILDRTYGKNIPDELKGDL